MKKITTSATAVSGAAIVVAAQKPKLSKATLATFFASLHVAAQTPAFLGELKKNAPVLFQKGRGQFVMPPHPLLHVSSLSVNPEAEYKNEDDINRVYRLVGLPELSDIAEGHLLYSEVWATLSSVVAGQATKFLGRLLILKDNRVVIFVDDKKNVFPVYS